MNRCREINEVLSQGLYQDRKVKEAYLNWRDQFDLNLQHDLRITMAAESVVNITSKMEAKLLKQKMSQWNKQAHFQKRVRVFLRHLFWRQYISNVVFFFNLPHLTLKIS